MGSVWGQKCLISYEITFFDKIVDFSDETSGFTTQIFLVDPNSGPDHISHPSIDHWSFFR